MSTMFMAVSGALRDLCCSCPFKSIQQRGDKSHDLIDKSDYSHWLYKRIVFADTQQLTQHEVPLVFSSWKQ